jgi:hypothetical protein
MVLFAALGLAVSCKGPSTGTGTPYFPCAVGTRWNCRYRLDLGNYPYKIYYTASVTSSYEVDNSTQYAGIFSDTTGGGMGGYTFYVTGTDDSLLMTVSFGTQSLPDVTFCLFPKPLESKAVGTQWIAQSDRLDPPCVATLVGRRSVAVPSGSYADCIGIEYSNMPLTDDVPVTVWFARDVGPVLVEVTQRQYPGELTYYELTSYVKGE